MRLDDLQTLVHQCRGVRRDQRAHVPGGMSERLGRRDVLERGAITAAERAAAGGHDQLAHLVRPAAAQALRQRRVLRVDRAQLPAPGPAGDQRATRDQGFLVGERDRASRVERGERGAQPGRAGDRVEHDVAAERRELHHCAARDDPRSPAECGEPLGQFLRGIRAPHAHRVDAELGGLAGQQFDVGPARGDRRDREPLRGLTDNVERLRADRTRRTEDDHATLHAPSVPAAPRQISAGSSTARSAPVARPGAWRHRRARPAPAEGSR